MADPKGIDKMPLRDYVISIADQVASALEEVEHQHPQWQTGKTDIIARGVLKPMRMSDGTTVVYIDISEPANEPVSEIPISLRWKDGATSDATP